MAIPVILCIGSASVTGDSLGPMVGDLLRDKYRLPAFVYGGLRAPVNGVNYEAYLAHLLKRHPESLVIAVDACVGEPSELGRIKFSSKGLAAGGALNKNFARVGDLGILGVVAPKSEDNLSALMSVPYSFVARMSERIAYKIYSFLNELSAKSG